MDLQTLHNTFAATLDADGEVRNQAETALRTAERQPLFAGGCLDLLVANNVEPAIKTAAGVYLKNTVARVWRTNRPENDAEFKIKLLQGLQHANANQRPIFLVVLHKIIEVDYPEKWPDLVPRLHGMLSSESVETVWAGLSGVLKVSLRYRWSNLKGFDSVLASVFPLCLAVAEAALASETAVAGSMLYDFAKIYKYATSRILPAMLQSMDVIGRTVQVFVRVLEKNIVYQLDETEREYTPWAKAKKWSSYNLLRTHAAFVSNSTSLSKRAEKLAGFRKEYSENLTPPILDAVLKLLEQWSQGNLWLPQPAICNLLTYLEGTPNNKQMWSVVEPYVDGLLQHVIYPLLCATEHDMFLFENEPVEFVHKSANAGFEQILPDQAAENLLQQLVQRRKDTFALVIQFIQTNRTPGTLPPTKRVGILRMLDIMSKVITMKNNPVQNSMESFIVENVLPDVGDVAHPIIRAQALHLIGTYARLPYERSVLQKLYEAVHTSLFDSHLPVQVEAAGALQGLAENEDVKAAIGEHIPSILQHLLNLTKQIDLDSILVVMDDFINMHPEQVTPFAIELVSQLRDQFLSTASEIAEAADVMPDNFDLDEDDALSEKKATASSIIRTVENLQYSLEHHKEILIQLEAVIMPIFQAVYEHELLEFYPETLALHENTMYCTRQVSAQMWQILPMCITAIESSALECLDDANAAFENYITYGADTIAQEVGPRDAIMQLILNILSPECEDMLTVTDWMLALQLAKKALGTKQLREGPMNSYIAPLITHTATKMSKGSERIHANPAYGVALITTVFAAIYNSPQTLVVLSEHNLVSGLASLWFSLVREVKNVENLKFQELAILSILVHMPAEWNDYTPQLLKILAMTMEALPGAISRLEEQRKVFDEDDYGVDNDVEADNWDDIEEQFPDDDTADLSIQNKTDSAFAEAQFSSFKHDFIQYDFAEDRDANPYIQSPIDEVNPYIVLRETLEGLNSSKPEFYQMAMSTLSETERANLQDAVLRA